MDTHTHTHTRQGTGAFSIVWRGVAKYSKNADSNAEKRANEKAWALKEIKKSNLDWKEENNVREEVSLSLSLSLTLSLTLSLSLSLTLSHCA
jgi:hypothetical protein